MRTLLTVLLLTLAAASTQAAPRTLCTLVIDAATGAALHEAGDCDTRTTPASTFKLALAIIGFEEGFLTGPHAPVLPFRPGDPDWGGANWTRETGPTDWLRYSVVWYSQRITHALGEATLTRHARAFGYGNADFSGDPGFGNGLDRAWIASSLQISPREQTDFLRGLVTATLPVSPEAMAQTRAITQRFEAGGWVIHGKTGGAYPRRADRSFDYAAGWGWFVGWAEQEGRTLVFARLTQARERTSRSPGLLTRDSLLADWPKLAP
ncbi:class D beta-lactamase [Vannielia litorea]|uniref:class D beta-lactamase n=1 Tax=Vannielia litorea TaxID=1217970 RepID=UPI001C93CDC2|nr:class D beta-lactamase [Vannielia litorea]MBY6048899.1 class D beta-lactamase [Vannielia litorea]MBY6076313.1 class D beta-lactamase [Vannielia litorea]